MCQPQLGGETSNSRLESRLLVVNRDVLPLYPHRIVRPEVNPGAAVKTTADGKLLQFGAGPAGHASPAPRVAHCGAARVVRTDDYEVLSMPPDIVEARHGQRDVAGARVDLRMQHVGG